MDKKLVAKELLKMAKELIAADKEWTKGEWEAYKKEHPGTKIKPKMKQEGRQKDHTHVLPKGTPVRVYDAGPKVNERYTAVIDHPDWDSGASPGHKQMFSLGHSKEYGVNDFGISNGKEGEHLGKPVNFKHLPEEVQKAIHKKVEIDS